MKVRGKEETYCCLLLSAVCYCLCLSATIALLNNLQLKKRLKSPPAQNVYSYFWIYVNKFLNRRAASCSSNQQPGEDAEPCLRFVRQERTVISIWVLLSFIRRRRRRREPLASCNYRYTRNTFISRVGEPSKQLPSSTANGSPFVSRKKGRNGLNSDIFTLFQ